jgi:hypothetical protein
VEPRLGGHQIPLCHGHKMLSYLYHMFLSLVSTPLAPIPFSTTERALGQIWH